MLREKKMFPFEVIAMAAIFMLLRSPTQLLCYLLVEDGMAAPGVSP
jgi:hypothetical protein